jgi:hypothetical protein
MANLTRSLVLTSGERLTPAKLNALITGTTVTNVTPADLGADFGTYSYGDTAPGFTNVTPLWYDTTAGSEGMKYAFLSPSNVSIAAWCYLIPRREAIYWATTHVSLGAPLFFLGEQDSNDQVFQTYDGAILPKVQPVSSEVETRLPGVVAMESVNGPGPVKCAWAGIVPVWAEAGWEGAPPASVDPDSPAQWNLGFLNPLSVGLRHWWNFNEASGATAIDSKGNMHLADYGGVGRATTHGVGGSLGADFLTENDQYYFSMTGTSTWSSPSGSFSVHFYGMPERIDQTHEIVNVWSSSDRSWTIKLDTTNDRWVFIVNEDNATNYSVEHPTTPSDSVANHVTAIFDTDTETIGIWMDGTGATASAPITAVRVPVSIPFLVGANPSWPEYFAGNIDNLGIWDRVLTQEEITALEAIDTGDDPSWVNANGLDKKITFGTALGDGSSVSNPGVLLWGTGPGYIDRS